MRAVLLLVFCVVACSRGAKADLPSIAEARSLGAEWALVNDHAAKGDLTAAYTKTMRKSVRQQLKSAVAALTQPNSSYAKEMQALAAEPDGASPAELRGHAAKLKQIEASLESA